MSPYRIAVPLALVCGLAGSARAQGETTCARDLLVAQSMQRQAIDQLEQADGDDAKNCRVWRRHVETMRRVSGVYGRCLSGSERAERLAQVQGSDREFSAAIKARCRGQ
ncbi:hypothetical protein SAMN05216360_10674 [Methylobacterium phyllostachyos]|uniref:UrcA family protein n=1 Tax=Methylobacterium phyllostachyos TaxID=582672 RepID=A0A1G9Z1N9_9HYPH|nr:hypothetical protein [Methylobacterium phyllostachyos]SDN15332.1 hypothetical protein SAMN05216360_10674 [Methylobacterium phyllostachyos]